MIIGCMAVAILDTTINDLRSNTNKSPAFKIILGGFVVTVTLLIVSDSQPEIAETMALLILLATLFGPNGTALADLATKLTTNPATVKAGAAVAAAANKGAQPPTHIGTTPVKQS